MNKLLVTIIIGLITIAGFMFFTKEDLLKKLGIKGLFFGMGSDSEEVEILVEDLG